MSIDYKNESSISQRNMLGNENGCGDSYYYACGIRSVKKNIFISPWVLKGVKSSPTISWLKEKLLLREVCTRERQRGEEENELLNTSNWANSITHIKQYNERKNEKIESDWRASYVDWIRKETHSHVHHLDTYMYISSRKSIFWLSLSQFL